MHHLRFGTFPFERQGIVAAHLTDTRPLNGGMGGPRQPWRWYLSTATASGKTTPQICVFEPAVPGKGARPESEPGGQCR
jgi:hypothetical protein